MHGRTSVLVAPPASRHGESAVADLAASHRALDAPALPIEGARMHAPGISTGTVAVFVRFGFGSPRRGGATARVAPL